MFLKSLKIAGFKSFADRTRLELRPGLTVVVGPNGSGKSNIVDALAWVLGSQSPKSLRTDRMDDVIFAGTATRPGVGRAEVTLVLDNGSGMMAIDLPEVSITRRLYRDGSSDYEINGVGCRLLDIQDLLSDSGVGKTQHVIIGQGQIDSVLNAGPEDHRAVIEEAAGILKHRIRKEKTIRRLERTDGDVTRLTDLLGELKRQMRPLKRQADAANRYEEVAGLARSLRLHVAGSELRAIDSRVSHIDSEMLELEHRVVGGDAELQEASAALAILRDAAGEVGALLDRDGSAAARLETTAERLRRIGSVAHERARSARARMEGAGDRLRDLEEERAELSRELDRLVDARPGLVQAADTSERRFRALEDEERSLADQESMSSEGAVAVVRGNLRSLDAAAARDEREIDDVERRREALTERRRREQEERDRINEEIRTLDVELGPAQSAYQAATEARSRSQAAWEEIERRRDDAAVAVAGARARLAGLEEAAAGLADPRARSLAESANGARGSVVGRLDVSPDLAQAVDAALGPWADAICFDGDAAMVGVVETLKGEGRGGVPMVATAPKPGSAELGVLCARAAELGAERLIDLLGPAADRTVATALLGDVMLTASWSLALRIVREVPELRLVTTEGDLVTRHGIRVAHPDGATPAMLEAAAVAAETAERDHARLESLANQRRREFDDARSLERRTLEALEALETRVAGASEAMARLDRMIESADHDLTALDQRAVALHDAATERATARTRLVERLAALEGEEAERQRAWEQLVERRRTIGTQREQARATWQEASTEVRAVDDRTGMIQRRLHAIAAAIAGEETSTIDPARIRRLEQIDGWTRRAVEGVRAQIEALRTRQAELRVRAGTTGSRIGVVQATEERLRQEVAECRSRSSDLSVELAELRVRAESIAEGLRRDLDVDEQIAKAAPAPEIETPDAEAELRRVEAELRRMGPINPLAAEEYAEKSERYEFLTGQLDDLESARSELRSVISALDEEIEQRFLAAYQEAAAAFEEHFTVLFPGGRGRLRLADPDDPLGSGVEIEAQPLGKKVAKMSLLSGGERSLAALAFLFSVFRARPSPFYVLDEVEAALDDANLRRFLRLVESFRSDAQLVVVTHQQQTMEAADVLYGVTMEPGGSSTVVAKALTEAVVEI